MRLSTSLGRVGGRRCTLLRVREGWWYVVGGLASPVCCLLAELNCAACGACGLQVLMALLEKGADPTKRTKKGEQPLHCAAEKGHIDAIGVLLDTPGCDVNAPGPYKATPLHVASTPAVAELLLSRGADPSIKYRGRTPYTYHTEKGNTATAQAEGDPKKGDDASSNKVDLTGSGSGAGAPSGDADKKPSSGIHFHQGQGPKGS